ncbi:TonB-dependent receptor plug domain-containing protein [Daejeonella oryzae]|uniref:TonB-dependent receptor plug domain-containing protein n=1 Tax=Daejeonella oryzae TaxID=1122943 RepID=UPI00040C08C4|nr:TonB-dependent receptor [Daejeonella oryzae]
MKRKNLIAYASFGLASTLLFPNSSKAQENPVRKLDDVVVTASRTPKKQSETGKVVRVITSETLNRSQGRTLSQVLNEIAGITIGGSGGNPGEINAVYLRGSSPGYTLILIDGIPVNDASGISGEINISSVPIDQVERVEILKGGNSTLYGSDAVAGVINIITKKGRGKLSTNLLASAGSYDSYKQVLGLNGQIDKTSVAINISNADSRNFSTAKSALQDVEFEKDASHQKSISLNIGQQITDRLLLRSLLQAGVNEADLDNGAFTDGLDYDYKKSFLLAGFTGIYEIGKSRLDFNLSRNQVKNLFDNQASITNNQGNITNAEGSINYSLTNFLNINSGASYKYSDTKQISSYSATLIADNHISSLYTSALLTLKSGFNFEIGGRINKHSQYGSNFTYTLNPSFVIDKQYKIYVNVSSAYKVPSLYQLFSEYGNLDLKAETSKSYEAGFDLDLLPGKVNLNFNYFKRNINDVIDFGQSSSGKYVFTNQNLQQDNGYEAEIFFKPSNFINVNAFFAYVNGKQISPAGTSFNLLRRPTNSFGANVYIIFNRSFDFNISYKYTGDRADRYFDGTTFEVVEIPLKSYNMVNAYLQYKPSKKLTFFTDVKNILNEDYTEFAGYTTAGLNYQTGLKLDF